MKLLLLSSVLVFSLFANQLKTDFNDKSTENQLLCKITSTTYKIISKHNSSIATINKTTFFKLKDEDTYINSSACHKIRKENTAIIF